MVDVSVVLNIHRASNFLIPSLRSICNAILVAQDQGVSCELVAVFDCSDEKTKYSFEKFNFNEFNNVLTIEVTHGSLSLSRNSGIKNAHGKYIFTADDDDLITSNSIFELYNTAVSNKLDSKSVYFLNYLFAFGDDYYVAEFINSESYKAVDFIANNPYTSRIFARREILLSYPYHHTEAASGFAFEDWDLVNRLFSDGFEFHIAKNTILFYRIRKKSLLSNSILRGTDLVPRSKLHTLDYLLEQRDLIKTFSHPKFNDRYKFDPGLSKIIFQNDQIIEQTLDAIEIDPTINFDLLKGSKNFSPIPIKNTHWAFAYLTCLRLLGNTKFTDIVLLPFLNPGGGEKYILQILESIKYLNKSASILILTLEPVEKNSWKSKLDESYTFLDIRNSFPYLLEEDFEKLLINLLLITEGNHQRLHLKTSFFAENFVLRYQNIIAYKFSILYYRFSDSVYKINGRELKYHNTISFLRNSIEFLGHVLTDNYQIIEDDRNLFGEFDLKKYSLIESYAVSGPNLWKAHDPNFRILWASRISWEKRPNILPIMIGHLIKVIPNLTIDLFGSDTLPDFLKSIENIKELNYMGTFDGFETLPINDYDLMVYTSKFDGAPNVLIEAMISGIPIVAPEVGGIKNLFAQGFDLIPNLLNDNEISIKYSEKIIQMYQNWPNSVREAEVNRDHAIQRFHIDRHRQDVKKLMQKS